MTEKTLYGVNIHGPDDLIAAPSYEMAVRIANAFNDWWMRHIHVDRFTDDDPMMWAVPVVWPYAADTHTADLDSPSTEYKGFIDFARDNAPAAIAV